MEDNIIYGYYTNIYLLLDLYTYIFIKNTFMFNKLKNNFY